MLKKIGRSAAVKAAASKALEGWIRFLKLTNRAVTAEDDLYRQGEHLFPAILAQWHGEHYAAWLGKPSYFDVKVLISRSRDGDVFSRTCENLDMGVIRASGGRSGSEVQRKGGVYGLRAMTAALEEGCNITLTADVPKKSRRAGEGIVMLAKHSGRPVVPFCAVTSNHIRLSSWDRAVINLPFGRMAAVLGEPIFVPEDATREEIEVYRQKVEEALNDGYEKAYEIAAAGKLSP